MEEVLIEIGEQVMVVPGVVSYSPPRFSPDGGAVVQHESVEVGLPDEPSSQILALSGEHDDAIVRWGEGKVVEFRPARIVVQDRPPSFVVLHP